ncbi:ABC transporter ATP-binding protein [Levilactobacillus brevis]|nr:ABC transporter ATP-binding protein [Levilactobacillus brevis]
MVNTILKEADLFCPNSVRINFTIYLTQDILRSRFYDLLYFYKRTVW